MRLRRVYELAVATRHVKRFIVFGSFVTGKPEPNDVDVFLVMDDAFDLSQVTGEARLVFDHPAAQAYFGASIFWLRRLAALPTEEEAVLSWQLKRDGTRRGIVEVEEA
jgi:predicted nucleotidyltransferase